MEKKIMIAVDGSVQAKQAVDYAAALAQCIRPLTFSLCHVQPPISQYLEDEAKKTPTARAQLDALMKKNAAAARQLLGELKASLVTKGIDAARVEIDTRMRTHEVDRILLSAAEDKRFDALVLGQRGISGIQKAFIDSVSSQVLQQRAAVPIWLVRGRVTFPDRILVAVDGSPNAFRAVDHLAFMLSGNADVRLTFFHVRPTLKAVCPIVDDDADIGDLSSAADAGDRRCMDAFLHRALERLADDGIGEERVDVITVEKTLNIGKAILEKAKKGDFGTVVVGRRGLTRTFFSGSVSSHLIDRLSDRALWVVQ